MAHAGSRCKERPGRLLATGAVVFSLAAGGLAIAQPGNRQTIAFVFDQQRPDSGTGVRVDIDYLNPDDPGAKPPAVQTVVETLAPGTRIDTSVPARCGASDAQLMVQGAPACPVASRVGGGLVDLDTGIPGPGRIVQNKVTEFNNANELIILFEPTSGSGSIRAVARAPITDGRTITAQSPPLPGGPPDGFTAIKKVRLNLEAISVRRGAKTMNYVTTPHSCPAHGSWTNTITFTYRDGVNQAVHSASPCQQPHAGTHSSSHTKAAARKRRRARKHHKPRRPPAARPRSAG